MSEGTLLALHRAEIARLEAKVAQLEGLLREAYPYLPLAVSLAEELEEMGLGVPPWGTQQLEQPAHPVSEPSGEGERRDVDNETAFEADMRQFPDLFKRQQ